MTEHDARHIVENHAVALANLEVYEGSPPSGLAPFTFNLLDELALVGWEGDDLDRLTEEVERTGYRAYMSEHRAAYQTLEG